MKSSSRIRLVLGTAALGLTAFAIACGGAEAVDVLGAPTQAGTSSSGASGASGTGGTSTSGGSSGTSGTGSSTSSSGGTSSSSSSGDTCPTCEAPPAGCYYPNKCDCAYLCPDAGGSLKCQWTKDGIGGCPDGSYCDAPSCGTGVCLKRGANEGPNKDAQCGCNGVTYWNTSIARKAGMAIRNSGACKPDVPGIAACGGFTGSSCPAGSTCNMQVSKKQECQASDQGGECWALPTQCPAVVAGGRARPCTLSVSCSDECNAIKKGAPWYDDGSCPQ